MHFNYVYIRSLVPTTWYQLFRADDQTTDDFNTDAKQQKKSAPSVREIIIRWMGELAKGDT